MASLLVRAKSPLQPLNEPLSDIITRTRIVTTLIFQSIKKNTNFLRSNMESLILNNSRQISIIRTDLFLMTCFKVLKANSSASSIVKLSLWLSLKLFCAHCFNEGMYQMGLRRRVAVRRARRIRRWAVLPQRNETCISHSAQVIFLSILFHSSWCLVHGKCNSWIDIPVHRPPSSTDFQKHLCEWKVNDQSNRH